MKDERLVECPYNSGVHYFVWHCGDLQMQGREPCVRCEAPDQTQQLAEILLDGTDGRRDPEQR